jgi:hypothetical protein
MTPRRGLLRFFCGERHATPSRRGCGLIVQDDGIAFAEDEMRHRRPNVANATDEAEHAARVSGRTIKFKFQDWKSSARSVILKTSCCR